MKHVHPGLVALTLSFLGAVSPLTAQRRPDMDAIVRSMLDERVSADAAGRSLVTEYRQTPDQTVRVMVRGGFSKRSVAVTAIRSLGMKPTDAVQTFKAIGYSPREVEDALAEAGTLVEMSCIDPDGYPALCGNPGGGAGSAMGAVTVIPATESFADSILVLESVNIPEVQVFLAGQALQVLEKTSTRVRVRLPSSPVSGVLTLRRLSDGVEGVLVDPYTVKKYNPPFNWAQFATVALEGAIEDAQNWIAGARIALPSCQVSGPLAAAGPGVLKTSTGFQNLVQSRLEAAGAPTQIAQAWDKAFRDAWQAWASRTTIPGLPWYPALAMFPGDEAPPIPNVPTPVSSLLSDGTPEMGANRIAGRVRDALGVVAKDDDASAAIGTFAGVLSAHFIAWSAKALILNVMGGGPVPVRKATNGALPSGPVVGGTCSGENVLTPIQF